MIVQVLDCFASATNTPNKRNWCHATLAYWSINEKQYLIAMSISYFFDKVEGLRFTLGSYYNIWYNQKYMQESKC